MGKDLDSRRIIINFESWLFFRNNIKSTDMIEQTKDQYVSPECEVLTLQEEGVICSSVPDIGKGGEYTWP